MFMVQIENLPLVSLAFIVRALAMEVEA